MKSKPATRFDVNLVLLLLILWVIADCFLEKLQDARIKKLEAAIEVSE